MRPKYSSLRLHILLLPALLLFVTSSIAQNPTSIKGHVVNDAGRPVSVRLPRLVSDSMVLQRDQPMHIWGWADVGERVAVRIVGAATAARPGTVVAGAAGAVVSGTAEAVVAGAAGAAVAGADGKWEVILPAMPAGGPYNMEIGNVVLKGVLIGDVWVCSGQSNMDLPMERVKEKYADVIAAAGNSMIRQYAVETRYDFAGPRDDLGSGRWESATPASVSRFSAVGYFFARELYERYRVPVGLIKAAVGGSPAEAWLSAETLKSFPVYERVARQFADPFYVDSIRRHDRAADSSWYLRLWMADTLKGREWKSIKVPGYWVDQGLPDSAGVVWYKKEIDLPVSMAGQAARLWLGRIVDRDSVFVNGVFCGTTGYQYPPRRYTIPAGVLKARKNQLIVRVIASAGRGGMVPDKEYYLEVTGQRVRLEGEWSYRVGTWMPRLAAPTFFQYQPGGLYNGIVAALASYSIKGVIWYQGEANAARAGEYERLFRSVIIDWRRAWKRDSLPFLYVQLANFMQPRDQPIESQWAELREAQSKVLALPFTGMAVTIDVGEWNDIHPLDKEDVGKRLALAARKVAYGENNIVYSGPVYRSMRKEGNRLWLRFDHTGGGLVVKGSVPAGFAVAGFDGHYVWANARVERDEVVVWSDQVTEPWSVRYAWADNPGRANLYNKEGLPASPFRAGELSPGERDHRLMMKQLHIDSLRPGPSGNPAAPDAANSDERNASPYTRLPDPLVLRNGQAVRTAKDWWSLRRPEIVEEFDREVYGRVPLHVPGVKWEVVERLVDTVGGVDVIKKKLLGHVDNTGYALVTVDIELEVVTPAAAKRAVPLMLELGWKWPAGMRPPPVDTTVVPWQEQVIRKGWGYAIIYPTSIQADNGAGLTSGIIGLCNKGQRRKPDDWGALRAWAWGVSRALDYFETDTMVDAKQVGVEGLSRYGKAAAVAMAYDPRIAIGFIGSSGEGGVKIHRRHFGEQVENVASAYEYHWMAGNFLKYAGPLTPNDLPVDAHELVALCAPRPVFISAGSAQAEGNWIDAKGMFLGGVGAGPVYRLLGKGDLGTSVMPPIETGLVKGEIAWRQHSGGHTTGPNWVFFLLFADKYLRAK